MVYLNVFIYSCRWHPTGFTLPGTSSLVGRSSCKFERSKGKFTALSLCDDVIVSVLDYVIITASMIQETCNSEEIKKR